MIRYLPTFVLRCIKALDDMALDHLRSRTDVPADYYRHALETARPVADEVARREARARAARC